ncbi:hypothetical protein HZ994_11020 [Akkermansiaceae bacterium]|nr:hypothetical protein HZ994_11020 [Akkermansiaceae bacterium]
MRRLTHGFVLLASAVLAQGEAMPPTAGENEPPPFTVTEKEIQIPGVTIDRNTLEVRIAATVCLTSGILEYVVCKPGTFEHEAIFTTTAKPELVHAALLLAGLKPTQLIPGLTDLWWGKAMENKDSRVNIDVEWQDGAEKKRASLSSMLRDRQEGGGKPAKDAWVFAGSVMVPHPVTGARQYAGNASGILVGIWPDPSTVIQYGIPSENPYENSHNGLEIDEKHVPGLGTGVTLVFSRQFPEKAHAPVERDNPR